MNATVPSLPDIRDDVVRALNEDVGSGDITALLVPNDVYATATVICREPAVICGRAWFEHSFLMLDNAVRIEWQVDELRGTPLGSTYSSVLQADSCDAFQLDVAALLAAHVILHVRVGLERN